MGILDSLRRNFTTQETVNDDTDKVVENNESEINDTESVIADQASTDDLVTSEPVTDEEIPPVDVSEGEPDIPEDEEPLNQDDDFENVPENDTNRFEPGERIIKPYSEKNPVTHTVGTTKIISIINQKGGVGKSTTALNLAFILGDMGKEVLLVDLDPQGNATSGLGVEKRSLEACIYDVLLNDLPVTDAVLPDIAQGLDLLPATINLAGAEVELVSAIARENRLKDALGSLRGRYDYIFVDCPPSLGLLTINGLVAADSLIIPIQSEFYALEGVTKLLDSMKLVKSRLNPSLDVFGVLITMYDGRTTLSRQVANEVRNYFGKSVFDTYIPRTVKLSEAPSYGMSIQEYDPSGKGAQAYRNLAKEVIQRG